jgi:hypothetical protein
MGFTVTAPTLIEQHDLENLGVKPFMGATWPPRTRAAVHNQRRPAVRIAPDLPVDAVAVTDIEQPVLVNLWLGKRSTVG